MNRAADLLDRVAGLRVLVIGDAMLDRYISGPSTRLSPEAAVPVVAVERCDEYPGGAANSAANAAALGATATLFACIGDEPAGRRLQAAIAAAGVHLDPASVVPGRRTLAKTRVMAGSTPVVRFDEGETSEPEPANVARLRSAIEAAWDACDAVVISDYGYGVLGAAVRAGIAKLQRARPRVLAVDARDLERYRECRPNLVKPNLAEARRLTGIEPSAGAGVAGDAAGIEHLRGPLFDRTGAGIVALTMGDRGAAILRRDAPTHRTFARPSLQTRAAGAGDSYLAAFALGLAACGDPNDCAALAAEAAQLAVDRDGTRTCSASELRARLSPSTMAADGDAWRGLVDRARRDGRRIVFTNGVFDLLHSGHVRYLETARQLGDVLVVGLNSDASVSRLKGPSRPINHLAERAAVLSALGCVDAVIPFEEDTPERLIAEIRPDIYVKGGDYTREQLPEADLVEAFGGTVVLLDHHDGLSTTGLIQRVHALPGAARKAARDVAVALGSPS